MSFEKNKKIRKLSKKEYREFIEKIKEEMIE